MDRIREPLQSLWELLDNIPTTPPTAPEAVEVDECCLMVWLLADTLNGPVVTQMVMACTINKLIASHFFSPHLSLSRSLNLGLSCTTLVRFTPGFKALSLSALHNSDRLSILGCGYCHLSGKARPPPSAFCHFLPKPFFSLLPPISLSLGSPLFCWTSGQNVPQHHTNKPPFPPAQNKTGSVAFPWSKDEWVYGG